MRHGDIEHFWRLGSNSLNTELAIKCSDLKEITSRLLRASGINAPENAVFESHDAKRAWAWAEPVVPVVVKPKNGLQGTGVFVDIDTWEDFSQAFETVASMKNEVLVERFHPGNDHRVLVINNKVVAATRRFPANVCGDGILNISELVEAKNKTRRFIHKKLTIDGSVHRHLQKEGRTLSTIPKAGEIVFLRGTANLHTGGDAMDATDSLTEEQITLAENASRAIPGLLIAGFDILLPDSPKGKASVLEVNQNPMISMHHYPWIGEPRDAASAVLNAMFPETNLA
nr:ATP-grasp domain-containing protein [Leucobacter chinensis]